MLGMSSVFCRSIFFRDILEEEGGVVGQGETAGTGAEVFLARDECMLLSVMSGLSGGDIEIDLLDLTVKDGLSPSQESWDDVRLTFFFLANVVDK